MESELSCMRKMGNEFLRNHCGGKNPFFTVVVVPSVTHRTRRTTRRGGCRSVSREDMRDSRHGTVVRQSQSDCLKRDHSCGPTFGFITSP